MILKQDLDYDECIVALKEAILRESKKYGKLINPLNSDSKNVLGIMCTWNQMFKAMELAEKAWKEEQKPEVWKPTYKEALESVKGAVLARDDDEENPVLK
jgi:hypothetical protein